MSRSMRNLALAAACLVAPVMAHAEVGSDKSAAIVVFPKVVIETNVTGNIVVNTIIQLSNTAPHQIAARCFLVNANSHCSNAGAQGGGFTAPLVCEENSDCNGGETIGAVTGGRCIAGWSETDFRFQLTARQPIVWVLSDGLASFPLNGLTRVGPVDNDPLLPPELQGQPAINADSRILPAPEIPFRGELKCVQVDLANEQPTQGTDSENNFGGDLKGEATIVRTNGDARTYNAIGIQALQDANDGDDVLVLGQEYSGCPNVLILDHFFDDVIDPVTDSQSIRTVLTLVPCSENFLIQDGGSVSTVAQMLVFNEFEQRFSLSKSIRCYDSTFLSDLASGPGRGDDSRSIFNAAVAGTLTGQTRIRGVDGGSETRGDGLLGVAEEFHEPRMTLLTGGGAIRSPAAARSAAFNLHFTGERSRPDFMVLAPGQ
jgi:hypothetical protein